MASRRRGGDAGHEGPSKPPKLSRGVGGRRTGRLAPEVSTPVPAARRRRKTGTETSAATAAPRSTESSGAQRDTTSAKRDTSSPATPPSSDCVASSSSGILSVATTATADPSPSAHSSEDDEVETMRWHGDREDQLDPASDGGACGSSFVVSQESGSGSRRASSVVVTAPGRVGSAFDGPFNSTMVEGAVPIHQMPLPSMTTTGGQSTRTLVPDTEDGALDDIPQPLPPPPPPLESSPTVVIPPCPLGLHRQMQLREMRRHGVLYSWELPPP
ncbi:uncharacterized protein LOC119389916 [Rhipicephalus sanguineus]|uniref:Uncharacterized protein n=1 Tax=Rhipicephalus sanguineus TaxID=34632 RepID=A0A9D4PWT5_RHISA|nr:uncharacterized protein LOC119389916 [Rhipicephalus sanguineus]KAH7957270.1 hypothetical protein HPB52_016983 [Rhipicephalus sanguineus]